MKCRGDLFLNGNVINEADLINMTAEHVLNPKTLRDDLNETKKVLIITAAWSRGHEFNDRHIIGYFEDLGIDAKWQNGFPTNIQNLGLYSAFMDFIHEEPELYAIYHAKQEKIKKLKKKYSFQNKGQLNLLFKDIEKFKKMIPNLGLFDLFYSINNEKDLEFFTKDLDLKELDEKIKGIKKLHKSKKAMKLAQEICKTLNDMIKLDNEVYQKCKKIEEDFFENSGILHCELYHSQREEMINRIMSSATIYTFGGRVYVLNNRLRFYQLGEIFKEALNQGTNMYGISAGSIVMSDNFALNFEEQFSGGFLRAEDFGMGLLKNFWVFPHANDYEYITHADEDKLSLFTIRHFPDICIGLSCNSILRCEKYKDSDGKEYSKYSSAGYDPVLVFGVRGRVRELNRGDEIITKGTKFFSGESMIFTKDEVIKMYKKQEMNELKKLGNLTLKK